jgi:uncharacterized protein (TIGR03084 family)
MVDDRLDRLLRDLGAETKVLESLLDTVAEDAWALPTPAAGWSIGDQVTHLAYFDDAATLAATDGAAFRNQALELEKHGPNFSSWIAEEYRSMPSRAKYEWLRRSRDNLIASFGCLESKDRVPWYGPSMSVASAVTARLMETWAHGQDIASGLSKPYPQSERLQQVAHLGVSTFGFSFRVHGLEVPDEVVRVELTAPDGTPWVWGDPTASSRVSGAALDFCYVVTQRRHVSETQLVASGSALQWLEVAQAFAGPPTNRTGPQ